MGMETPLLASRIRASRAQCIGGSHVPASKDLGDLWDLGDSGFFVRSSLKTRDGESARY